MTHYSEHDRAERLIAQKQVEGLPGAEERWLTAHLETCAPCAAIASSTEQALRSLRAVSIVVPPALARRTQLHVHLRAQQAKAREPYRRLMWLACAVSWAFGALTAPYVWRALEWFGQRTGLPRLVPDVGFGLWWAFPAIVAVTIVLVENARPAGRRDWFTQEG